MPPFRKILIANRGEIALRVIRSCRELGIRTVAVYSEADRSSLHVRFADEAVCIGPSSATRSYLHKPSVLAAAEITGADAVHPGYGFLAENAEFASAVRQMGLEFIGPSVEHLRTFGDKLLAKAAARAAGLPLLEGSEGAVESLDEALAAAELAGFPIILKAAGGGGGKGMRVVTDTESLIRQFEVCRAEAQAAFGTGRVFVERFVSKPRHVEVQVAGDGQGGGIWLGTRDCSMQRRHQKLIEEAPAPFLPDALHREILEAAARLVRDVGYQTVGTVEFLVEDDSFFFLEVNPRIQVEHPVTEMVTGVDLIAEQIRLAAGLGLSLGQDEVVTRGHAIEVRVNAENPWTLLPSPGRITGYHEPGGPGVRVDSAAHEHAIIPPYYDSMVAKLIVHGRDREHAIRRLQWAMDEFIVEGISTTLPMQKELIAGEVFRTMSHHTRYVDGWLKERQEKTSA
jgi:acetyl-CoA carboxylase biotin carboxylase subunit